MTSTPEIIVDYLCDLFGCDNGGSCSENEYGERICYCLPGFIGELCEEQSSTSTTTTPEMTTTPASTTPEIIVDLTVEVTTQTTTPEETTTQISTTPWIIVDYLCDFLGCANGGACEENESGGRVCFCLPGFTGELCQYGITTAITTPPPPSSTTPPPPTSTTPPIQTTTLKDTIGCTCDVIGCLNGGVCEESEEGDPVCTCPARYAGVICEVCLPHECPGNLRFDEDNCQCECDPVLCDDQFYFDSDTCKCRCKNAVKCPRRRYFNKDTCQCECLKVRKCLHPRKYFEMETCGCECQKEETCETGFYFDSLTCKCKRLSTPEEVSEE